MYVYKELWAEIYDDFHPYNDFMPTGSCVTTPNCTVVVQVTLPGSVMLLEYFVAIFPTSHVLQLYI